MLRWLLALLLALAGGAAESAEIRVAVANNFRAPVTELAARFEAQTGHRVILVFGATGKHYAQIRHGAPFDVFLAADRRRPARLEREGLAVPGSRFTYAIGALVLWSPRPAYVDGGGQVLEQGSFRFLAIANPKLAPYGKAAQEVMQARGVWERLRPRIVRGENIGQAYGFVRSGNAELGFVARSQLQRPGEPPSGSWWPVPPSLHAPIEQQAVLLQSRPAAREFLAFLGSAPAQALIRDYGYRTP